MRSVLPCIPITKTIPKFIPVWNGCCSAALRKNFDRNISTQHNDINGIQWDTDSPSARRLSPLVQKSNSLYTNIQSISQNNSVIVYQVRRCVSLLILDDWMRIIVKIQRKFKFWKSGSLWSTISDVYPNAARQFINIKVRQTKEKRKIEADCLCRIVQILETDFMQREIKRERFQTWLLNWLFLSVSFSFLSVIKCRVDATLQYISESRPYTV